MLPLRKKSGRLRLHYRQKTIPWRSEPVVKGRAMKGWFECSNCKHQWSVTGPNINSECPQCGCATAGLCELGSKQPDWYCAIAEPRTENKGIKGHDGQKLLVQHILDNDKGLSDISRAILERLIET